MTIKGEKSKLNWFGATLGFTKFYRILTGVHMIKCSYIAVVLSYDYEIYNNLGYNQGLFSKVL